jgi:DNA-directed RNA polymerase subunit RPC12/RpoP
MNYTDGLVIRCPECGALNVLLKQIDGTLYKCLSCEGSINPGNGIVYRLRDPVIE